MVNVRIRPECLTWQSSSTSINALEKSFLISMLRWKGRY